MVNNLKERRFVCTFCGAGFAEHEGLSLHWQNNSYCGRNRRAVNATTTNGIFGEPTPVPGAETLRKVREHETR